ncbi:hypothetical protein ACFL3S_07945 [Gemmatimonadota bacterium]
MTGFRTGFSILRSAGVVVSLFLGACELDEVSLAQPENVLVAEVYVFMGDGADQMTAFLHWTLGSDPTTNLVAASVQLTGEDGVPIDLVPEVRTACLVSEAAEKVEGTCFVAPPLGEGVFDPGERVTVVIALPDGRSLRGGTTLPGDFRFRAPRVQGVCGLPPDTTLEVLWTQAEGTWAYASETLIWGIREAAGALGIEVDEDPLSLLGLSVSASDTTIVFPSEFGVFSRFDLDRELTLLLQKGLPLGTSADVTVAALDRNYVNWIRGGNFNPSGQVRIPSLRGDGTGVLGSGVRRTFRADGVAPGTPIPSCFWGL